MFRRNFILTSLSALLAPLVKWGLVIEVARKTPRMHTVVLGESIVHLWRDIHSPDRTWLQTAQGSTFVSYDDGRLIRIWPKPGSMGAAKPQGEV